MPKLVEGNEITGNLTTEAASALGVSPSVVVCGGGGDAAVGGVGIGAINEGDALSLSVLPGRSLSPKSSILQTLKNMSMPMRTPFPGAGIKWLVC